MNFDQAFKAVIEHEKGYVNDPDDPGGETNYGISKRAYPHLDIKNLSLGQAKVIYLHDYWNKLRLDQLPVPVRFDMFDMGVNSGLGNAAKILQRAVGVADDGVIGPKTVAAANNLDPQLLDKRFNGQRLMFLSDNKMWQKYGRGWVKRVAQNLLND
jgi:lysozyme family protein